MTSLARQHYNMKQQYTKAPCHTTQHLVGSVRRHVILLRGMAVLCCLAMLLIHQEWIRNEIKLNLPDNIDNGTFKS